MADPPVLLTQDQYKYFGSVFNEQWGIFQNGVPVVTADSVVSMERRQEYAISDFPVEGGAFQSYNKVYIPFDVRFRFASGGSESNRQKLLDSVQAIVGNLVLYSAASPEAIYPSCNVVHYDYRRTAQDGVGLILVEVWLREVRVISSTNIATIMPSGIPTGAVAAPSGALAINAGDVQPNLAGVGTGGIGVGFT